MKILWITNMMIGSMAEHINGKPSHGLWMDALRLDFEEHNEHQLAIATIGSTKKNIKIESNNVTYYLLPGGTTLNYDCDKDSNIMAWADVIKDFNPDIIQIWGSEFRHGLAALRSAPKVPTVIYMQGIVESIHRYYLGGMSNRELNKAITIRDIYEHNTIRQQRNYWARQIPYEKELFIRAGNIIGENLWCKAHCLSIAPSAKYYKCPLSIGEAFFQHSWSLDKAEPFSIMCNASNYPLKGLQSLLRSIPLLKRKYPNVKLYIPGNSVRMGKDLKSRLKNTGFDKHIKNLIKKLDISENIVFTGRLTQSQLAELMSKVRVFAMCSAIENHSSTLKEAMAVGTPCVASAVGGVPEYVTHGENGFLYRFEEYEMAAEYISQIFESDSLAMKFSENGRANMHSLHSGANIYQTICDIYNDIVMG